ncbi:filamentous hemagglutinin N-terminal domain-containing protein [Pseudomonas rhodesiae]|uniref:two-partner secretion domain-containing protein n=1 Tax=Pseudomonas rhodesiae TaxID=76760 RepID=UPI000A75F7C8|nr:filamentous hemagglutinin N-terminal domain-containing protein [Pseudomonas rhodesiae]
MDVRQFAFLARQPSAALKPRDAFFGLPKRGLALILANALFWQPLLAQAEGIVVSAPGTTVGAAGNGVPVVNIATPNGAGLSHNQFQQYNVGPNGVILNNASGAVTNTQLGGYIVGNPNLKGGAASVILNEVTGSNPSQLRGYTEVAGQSAKVIVANPYGVTCSGCGFINTPNVTLTTGKPVLDANGQLQRYQVDGGAVTIDGEGLNASNVDRFDIITRSAKINAQINARELNVIAGRNDVDAQSLKTTPRADDGSAKPELAIDSSALGGMYAGAIKLVGTEAGVGVKLDGTLAASGGDIQLDANGRLSMAQAATAGNIKVTAQNVDLTDKVYATGNVQITSAQALVNQKSVAAGQRIELNAATVTNPGIVEAGVASDNSRNATGDLVVNAQTVTTSGNLLASRALAISAAQALTNQGAIIQAKTVDVSSAKLTHQGATARLFGEQSLAINSPAIVNLGGLIRFGDGQAATLNSASLNNQGRIEMAGGSLVLASADLNNSGGQIIADELTLNAGKLNNQNGVLVAKTATVNATELDNSLKGLIQADGGALNLIVSNGFNNTQGFAQASTDLTVNAGTLGSNAGGVLSADTGKLTLTAAQQLNNAQGRVQAGQGNIELHTSNLDNQSGVIVGKQLLLDAAAVDNRAGTVLGSAVEVIAKTLDNSGKGSLISDAGDITLSISDLLTNTGGAIDAGARSVLVKQLTTLNNQGGLLRGKRLDITAQHLSNDNGQLLAGNLGLKYSGQNLSNRKGVILSGGALTELHTTRLDNQGGTVQGDSLTVTADSADNDSGGLMASLTGNLQLTVEALANRGGKLFGKEQVTVSGATLDNSAGGQISGNQLSLTSRDTLTNRGGLIEANQGLSVFGVNLDNSAGGQLRALNGATSSLDLSGAINNQNGTLEFGSQDFSLDAGSLNNQAGLLQHAGKGLMRVHTASLTGSQGSINGMGTADWAFGKVDGLGRVQLNEVITYTSDQGLALKAGDRMASGKGLVLDVASLDNGGELLSDGDLSITTGDMTNTGRASALQSLTVTAHNLTQNGGRLAGTDTRLNLTGTLDSLGFLTARQQLDIAAAQINNRGTLGAQGAVNLTAVNGITNAADSLLFSGGNLTLRANGFSNLHGDVYSEGNLTFAARDGGRAAGFSNLSGTVESEGNIGIDAAFVENAKAEFELGKTITTGRVQWICGQHCKGHDWFKRGLTIIDQTYLEAAVKDSAPARLVAGGDMLIQGDNVQNRYSLMAANRNLSIAANDLLNQGAGTRTGQNHIVIGNAQKIDTDYWDWVEFTEIPAFNAALAAGKFDLAQFEALKARSSDYRFFEASNVTTWTSNGGHEYDATLQAGGTVDLSKVTRKAQNGTLHENTLAQLTGTLGDDQTGIPVGGININLSTHANDPGAQAPGSVLPVVTPAAGGGFVPVDYTGAAFASVDPTTSPNFQVPKGEYGLFVKNPDPTSHYLIETNPEFASLTGFFSSDYMLGKLGYSSDNAWRRLGDGQYETRLIRDAVLAQTGQRFLAGGLYSDADQFRYLMDNALASKDALRLSLGVTLTSQQVGALTHDIVWMENRVVDGQTVQVPVLYLAQAESRNVRGNSLIQGRDLNLFTGGDLINVGTLRASNNLSAAAGGSLYNGGLIEAGNNLTLLAQDSIRNAMAGEIRGKQVSLTALKGDITNETTAIQVRDGAGMRTLTDGSGGTIVARENLAMDAGRDLTNRGALVAGNDANLTASRDLNLIAASDTSVKHEIRDGGEKSSITTDVKNLAASVTAGGSINMQAGQDVNIIGSTATAGKDLNIAAGRDLNIASVSDMYNVDGKEKHGKKRIKTADEQTTQVASVLTAGGDFVSQAGRDTTIVASRISAGNEAYLYSGDKLSLLAAQNSTYSLYDMKEKGGWGAKKTKRDEVTRVTNVGTEIKTGGDLVLKSGGDQTYQLAKLQSGRDITLDSGGAITFEAVKDLHQESHEKSKNSLVWTSAKGKGSTDETLRQSQLIAQGQVVIKAVDGLKVDVTHVDQQTVSQAIDAMVKADPQLAWLKEAEKRGDVDWRRVQEVHDSFKYDHSSLGGGAALVIAIIVTYFTWGAGAGLVGAASTTTTGLVANSVVTAVAVKGATSTINNRGNISDIAKDVTSEDSIKGYAIAGLSGAIAKFAGVTGSLTTSDLGRQLAVNSALRTVTNGGSFTKNVGQAAIDLTASVLSGVIYEHVGTELSGTGLSTKVAVHAIVGGLIAEAAGGDFTAGAIAAGANKALIQTFGAEMFPGEAHDRVLAMTSQLIGMTAAAGLGGDAKDQEVAGWVAQQGTVYNYLEHSDVKSFASDMKSCGKDGRCQENKWSNERYNEESIYNTENALSITSSMLAKDKLPGVIVALDELMSIECQTAVCEGYKTELISRSVLVAGHLAKQIADWGPSMDRLALLSGGATGGGKVEPRSRLPGEVDPAGLVQLEKAIKYLKDTKGSSSGLVFGETKVVGTGKPAANDASFSVPKGYTQGADGVVTGPGGGIYKATGTLDSSGNQIYLGGNGNYYTLTVESSTRIVSPNPSLEIGVTGRIGEEALKSLGGQPQVTFQTTQGARVVDQLAPGSIAHESKVGYTSLDANTALQVAKDAELLRRGLVNGVTWNFFRSPVTGRVGPAAALEKALSEAGIKIKVH